MIFTTKLKKFIPYFIVIGLLFLLIIALKERAAPSVTQARNAVTLTEEQTEYHLNQYIEILSDPSQKLTIEQVVSSEYSSQFVQNKQEIPNLGYTTTAIWIRLRVKNQVNQDVPWLLVLSDAKMGLINLYLPSPDGEGYIMKKTGRFLPFSTRDIPHRHFVFRLPLLKQQETTIYLRFESESAMVFPLKIWSEKDFWQSDQIKLAQLVIYYGIVASMLGYNLFLWLSLKDANYLYCILFMINFSLNQACRDGLAQQFLWQNIANDFGIELFGFLTVASFLKFSSSFLETQKRTPRCHRLINLLLILSIIGAICSPFIPFITNFLGVIILICIVLCFLIVIKCYLQKYLPSRFYLIAVLIPGFQMLLYQINLFIPFPKGFMATNVQYNSTMIMMFFFSLAVADRINLMKQEKLKSQQKALVEAEEKEQLIREQNLILEQKVAEKTQSLLAANEQLRKYAYLDRLTGLPNRRFLLEYLAEELINENLLGTTNNFTILNLDVYHFQIIKYSLGHQFAEKLLVAVCQRLNSFLPPGGILARIEIDEFAILLKSAITLETAIQFVETIQQNFSTPLKLDKHDIFVQFKIGIVFNYHCKNYCPEEILRAGDTAMHQAKISKNANYAIFEPMMQKKSVKRLKLDSDLRCALAKKELQLYYQPILSLSEHKLQGFEALIRWKREGKFVSPVEFIPLAEETGFIVELGSWILEQASLQLQQWNLKFPTHLPLSIAVNLSPIQLIQANLVEIVDNILTTTNLPPQQLKLEITETTVMENGKQVTKILKQLKARKINLCLDDFGTGYSSLSYLHNLPFDTLKIDRAFVQGLDSHAKGIEVVKIIIKLAHALGMNVIAEGIETEAQREKLHNLGCDQGQGYLFSKPLSVADAEKFIEINCGEIA